MNQVRLKRLNNIFTIEISKILHEEIKDPDIDFVSITGCNITNDLSFCKVYFTLLNEEKLIDTTKALNGASSYIRKLLASRVEIRKMPELRFQYDNSYNYGKHMDKVIEELEKSEQSSNN